MFVCLFVFGLIVGCAYFFPNLVTISVVRKCAAMNCIQCERSCALCSGLKGPQRVQSGKRLGGTQAALQQPGIVPVWTQTETKLGNVSLDALGEPTKGNASSKFCQLFGSDARPVGRRYLRQKYVSWEWEESKHTTSLTMCYH